MPKSPAIKWLRSCAANVRASLLVLIAGVTPVLANGPVPDNWMHKVSPAVLQRTAAAPADFLVVLHEQADLSASARIHDKKEKGWYVYRALRDVATRTQRDLRQRLDQQEVEYRAFWVANMLRVHGDWSVLQEIARRPTIRGLVGRTHWSRAMPLAMAP